MLRAIFHYATYYKDPHTLYSSEDAEIGCIQHKVHF